MIRALFYSESAVFGGHEKMALAAHEAMAASNMPVDVEWLVNRINERLISELQQKKCKWQAHSFEPPFAIRRNYFDAWKKIRRVASILREMSPDLVVLVQGGITGSYDGVLASRWAHIPFCSYIAMAHRSTELATYRYPRLWNVLRSFYYRPISRFITIDIEQANRIHRENTRAAISIVENYVERPKPGLLPDAREEDGVAGKKILVIGVIGRIDFDQKCQDWLVRQIDDSEFWRNKFVLFVGDGPNASDLSRLIDCENLRARCKLIPWQQDMETIYRSLDLVLIPSRAEGVPLVMLEALLRSIPVVSANRDGMKTWLPKAWRFEWGDGVGMQAAVNQAAAAPGAFWDSLRGPLQRVTDRFRFGREFYHALESCLPEVNHAGSTKLHQSNVRDG